MRAYYGYLLRGPIKRDSPKKKKIEYKREEAKENKSRNENFNKHRISPRLRRTNEIKYRSCRFQAAARVYAYICIYLNDNFST